MENKRFDLCLTDPPFNVNYEGQNKIKREYQIEYEDNLDREEYGEWCSLWFNEIDRICNKSIIFCGNPNLDLWFKIKKPNDFGFHYKPNCQGRGYGFKLIRHDIFLMYGEFKNKLPESVINRYVLNGFLREIDWIHPCPNNTLLYADFIIPLKPISVIDPFLGSGTTAEVCTKLGIPWLGYEINEVYSQDIDKRLRGLKPLPKQTSILKFR